MFSSYFASKRLHLFRKKTRFTIVVLMLQQSHREDKDENKDKDADGGENAELQQEEAEQVRC